MGKEENRFRKLEEEVVAREGEMVTIRITPVWVGGGLPDEKGETIVHRWKANPGMTWKSANARGRRLVKW